MYGTSEKSSPKGLVPVLRMGNINRIGGIDWNNLVYTSNNIDIEKYLLIYNDLLFNRTNSSEWVGKTAIYKGNNNAIYAGYLIRIRTIIVNPDYINYVMNSSYHRNWCNDVKTDAVNQSNINAQKLSQHFIPIPPNNEQRRIVDTVQRWMNIIDNIENEKYNLALAIKQIKSKILDLAIHGKLVPQDPTDEPANELLKRINPKAEITCDNPHYRKLPIGWCLVRGKSLFEPMKSTKPNGTFFKYIDIDSIDNKRQRINKIKELKSKEAPSRACRYTEKGDIVFSMVRPYLRNIAKVTDGDCIASTGFYICRTSKLMLSDFCYYLMLSDYVVNGLNQFMKGDNSPSINKSNIEDWYYPLPPYKEQQRIVNAINKAFTTLDAISENL